MGFLSIFFQLSHLFVFCIRLGLDAKITPSYIKEVNAKLQKSPFLITLPLYMQHSKYVVTPLYVGYPLDKLYLLIDTGSRHTILSKYICSRNDCSMRRPLSNVHRKNFYNDSQLFKYSNFELTGKKFSDSVQLGNALITNQTMYLVDFNEKQNIHDVKHSEVTLDGILGIGLKCFEDTNCIFSNIVKQLGKNQQIAFSFNSRSVSVILQKSLSNTSYTKYPDIMGYLYLGNVTGIIPRNNFFWIRTNTADYWSVDLKELYVGEVKLCCDAPTSLHFDTGTIHNTFPLSEFKQFVNMMPKTYVPCSSVDKIFPVIKYIFENDEYLEIKPFQYIREYISNACTYSIERLDVDIRYRKNYILGLQTFIYQFIVFEAGKTPQIGILKNVGND